MRKVFLTMTAAIVFMSCGGGTEKKESNNETATTTNTLSSNPDYQKGLALVGASDCLTCHKVNEKNIGPAYKDVAAKYESTDENIQLLASKIIKGGSGVWGAIPMTPHPTIQQADAEAMVKYILLLKK